MVKKRKQHDKSIDKFLDKLSKSTYGETEEKEIYQSKTTITENNTETDENPKKKCKISRSAKDEDFYMSPAPKYDKEKGFEIREKSGGVSNAMDAILDLIPDEKDQILQKRNVLKWDRKKKKFVQTTLGNDINNMKKSKKRNESGVVIDENFKPKRYELWKEKTHLNIPMPGDDEIQPRNIGNEEVKPQGSTDFRFKNRNNFKKNKGQSVGLNKNYKVELKPKAQILKERIKKSKYEKNKKRQKH